MAETNTKKAENSSKRAVRKTRTGFRQAPRSEGRQPVRKEGKLCTLEGTDTIAGSCANLMQGMVNAVLEMGIPLSDAVLCAAENPVRCLGLSDQFGTLDPGKWASFVLLDENDLSVRAVYNRGVKIPAE